MRTQNAMYITIITHIDTSGGEILLIKTKHNSNIFFSVLIDQLLSMCPEV